MKKIFILSAICLASCYGTTDSGTGLVRLNAEPKNCEFLYTLNTTVLNYKIDDAYEFMEKRIMEQHVVGDSYYIVNQEVSKDEDVLFGPDNTYKFKTKVYKCKK